MAMMKYVIWSEEHRRWWRDGGWGYTDKLTEAGIFLEPRARSIVQSANVNGFNEVAFAVTDEVQRTISTGLKKTEKPT